MSLVSRLKYKPAGSGSQRTTLHTSDGRLVGILLPEPKQPLAAGDNETIVKVKKLLTGLPRGTWVILDNLYNFERLFRWATEQGIYLGGTMRPNYVSPKSLRDWLLDIPNKHEWKSAVRTS